MTVGELKAMLDQYGDGAEVRIVVPGELEDDDYTEFSVDWSGAALAVVIECEA